MKKIFMKNIVILLIFLFFMLIVNTHIVLAEDIDSIISGGKSFITDAEGAAEKIDSEKMKNTSNIIYNVLLTIAIGVAVIYASILGVKFMMGSTEDKAQLKESLIPFLIGCIIIFSSFAIWKAFVEFLKTI